jgi:EmrB/QacA subfamily drug resistance transporter
MEIPTANTNFTLKLDRLEGAPSVALSSGQEERVNIRAVLPGLFLALLLAMLDAMIVSTSLPTIVGQLGGFEHLSWVVAAYMLTSTVSTPLWGKFSDLYGRKQLFVLAIVIFLVGSALSGMAATMGMLIAFRAVQGVGAGGLWVGVMTIIGVLVPPKERGKYQSYIAALSAVATVGGPLVGGALTDNLSWRWAFYINLPIGVIALILVLTTLRLPHNRISHRIDYPGVALLTVATTATVLVVTWGGSQYDWTSPTILILLAVAVAAIVATILVERRAQEPVLPLGLFARRDFSVSLALGFLVGIGLYGSITFLPVYQQSVQHATATSSGLLLLPVLGGMLVASLLSGQAISRTGQYRGILIAGGAALAVGAFLLSLLNADTGRLMSSLYMLVFGAGLGLLFQNVMVVTQNSVELKDMGVASGSLTFFRNVGGLFGIALFATVFSGRLADTLSSTLSPAEVEALSRNGGRLDSAVLQGLPPATRDVYVHGVADATHWAFLATLPFFVLAFVVAFAVRPKAKPSPATPATQSASAAVPQQPGPAKVEQVDNATTKTG